MDALETMTRAIDMPAARYVYGERIEQDGTVLVPVATVRGGGGGGRGEQQGGQTPSGLGFGLMARPVGAFTLRGGRVRWKPAFDLNRALLGGQMVVALGLLVLRGYLRRRDAFRARMLRGVALRRWRRLH